jgi:hypothetical protein
MFIPAEKIIIYLTPFIFGIDLDIVLFDDEEKEVVKHFKFYENNPDNLEIKQNIFLINRRNHYETVYNYFDNKNYNDIYEFYRNDIKPIYIHEDEIMSNIYNKIKKDAKILKSTKIENSFKKEESVNNNINNNINNNMINQPNIPRPQVIPAQPPQEYNQNRIQNNQPYYQPQQRYNQNNFQNNPPYYQNIPGQYPPNPQQRMNMPPPPQQQYYNNYNNNYNNQIPRGNRMPYYNNNQNNPMFRSRKKEYPGSAKKGKNSEFNYEFSNQEKGYVDNNLGNYYEYPVNNNFNKKNSFAHSSSKKQENNYYHNEIEEFQENDYFRY